MVQQERKTKCTHPGGRYGRWDSQMQDKI